MAHYVNNKSKPLRVRLTELPASRAWLRFSAGLRFAVLSTLVLVAVTSPVQAALYKHEYRDVVANISVEANYSIAVTVHDHREYVLDGKKPSKFVGIVRGGFGNPWDVETASGNPLAADMTQSLVKALSAKGVKAQPVTVLPADDRQGAVDKLKSTGAERLLLLRLSDWKCDAGVNTAHIYDLALIIFDSQGNELASAELKGRDDLGGSVLNPTGHAKKVMPAALGRLITKLVESTDIAASLR